MRRLLPQIARVIAAGLLALLSASATTLEKLSLDDMIAKSTSIVRGRVQGCNGEYKAPLIYTHCKVAVSEHWKGTAPAVADVMILGGTANGKTQAFPGAPQLTEGQEYILFLWTGRSGMTQIIGFSQGAFDVSIFPKGEVATQKTVTADKFVDASGNSVADDPIRMTVPQFKGRVLSGVAARVKQ
jgi:hypothetical protein